MSRLSGERLYEALLLLFSTLQHHVEYDVRTTEAVRLKLKAAVEEYAQAQAELR